MTKNTTLYQVPESKHSIGARAEIDASLQRTKNKRLRRTVAAAGAALLAAVGIMELAENPKPALERGSANPVLVANLFHNGKSIKAVRGLTIESQGTPINFRSSCDIPGQGGKGPTDKNIAYTLNTGHTYYAQFGIPVNGPSETGSIEPDQWYWVPAVNQDGEKSMVCVDITAVEYKLENLVLFGHEDMNAKATLTVHNGSLFDGISPVTPSSAK